MTVAIAAKNVYRLKRKGADLIDQNNNNTYHLCSCCTLLIAGLISLS
jgi:hypothetical protein